MTKHLWNVASCKDTIWARWIHENRLKGRSIWDAKCDLNASYGWKQLIKIRDKVKEHFVCQVGNGASIFLWHDRWWGPDPLSKIIPLDSIEKAGLSLNMKVKDLVYNGQWKWPDNWLIEFPILSTIPAPNLCTHTSDKYMWKTSNGKCEKFSTNTAWKDMRQHSNKVEWYDIVWFSNCTPKHSFIMWLAIQGRLSTQDRLQKWYPDKEMACPLCESGIDSLNHLFFECSYSVKVWEAVQIKAGISLPTRWDNIIERMKRIKHDRTIKNIVMRLSLAACVYFIWSERNRRIFSNERLDHKELTTTVINHMRLNLSSLNVRKTAQTTEVSKQWEVIMKFKETNQKV